LNVVLKYFLFLIGYSTDIPFQTIQNMRNITYPILFISLALSACSSENIAPFMSKGCTIDLNYEDRTEESCQKLSTVCDPIDVPGKFHLVDNARLYLPQSCLEVGDKIYYENSKGKYINFEIILKDHALVRSSYTSFPPCATMPHYCFKSERYLLEMKSNKGNYDLEIEITVFVRGSESNWIQRDGMGIRDNNLTGIPSVFYLALYGQV